jgi:hypothetical protein
MVTKQDIALELLSVEAVSHAAVAKEIWGDSKGAARAKLSHRFRGDTPISDAEAELIIRFFRNLNRKIGIALAAAAHPVPPDEQQSGF